MLRLHSVVYCLTVLVIFTISPSASESVTGEPCKQKGESNTLACNVENIVVNPCPEAAENKPCKFKYNTNATISFDFEPEFDSEIAHNRAYWDQSFLDVPFLGMNTDACEFTKCPIKSGVKQPYSYSLPILTKYPKGEYLVKWKLWSAEAKKQCCFKVRISIVA